jgi:hypothetical protein
MPRHFIWQVVRNQRVTRNFSDLTARLSYKQVECGCGVLFREKKAAKQQVSVGCVFRRYFVNYASGE